MQSDFALVIEKRPVKNFWKGRGGFLPIAIVERMMQGSIEDAEQYFNGRSPEGVFAVSSHYGIARDGRVWQFVNDEDTAWSNGVLQNPDLSIGWLKEVYQEKVNCNLVTLSVDYEGYSGEALTPRQYEAALALHRQLTQRWEIEADNQHIIGHNWIDSLERSHNPGALFPFNQLLKDLHTAPSEMVQPPAPPNLLAYLESPMPEAEAEVVTPPVVETEQVAAYQPETVEEPAYAPQLEAFTFTPELNEEVAQVTAEPVEVEPATAEPENAPDEPEFSLADVPQDQPEEASAFEEASPVADQPEEASAFEPEPALPDFLDLPEESPVAAPSEAETTADASPSEEVESQEAAVPQEALTQPEEFSAEPGPEEDAAEPAGEPVVAEEALEAISQEGAAEVVSQPEEALAEPLVEEDAGAVSQPEGILTESSPVEEAAGAVSQEEPGDLLSQETATEVTSQEEPDETTSQEKATETVSQPEEAPSEQTYQFEDFDLDDIEASLAYQPTPIRPAPARKQAQTAPSVVPIEEAAATATPAEVLPEAQPEPVSQPQEVASQISDEAEEAALEAEEPEGLAAEITGEPENQPEVFDAPGQPSYLADLETATFAAVEEVEPEAAEPEAETAPEAAGQAEPEIITEPAGQAGPVSFEEAQPEEAFQPTEDSTAFEAVPVEPAEPSVVSEEPAPVETASPDHDDWAADLFAGDSVPGFFEEPVSTEPESTVRADTPTTDELEVPPAIGDDITPKYSRPAFFDTSYTYEPTPVELTSLDEVAAEPTSEAAIESGPVEEAVEAVPAELESAQEPAGAVVQETTAEVVAEPSGEEAAVEAGGEAVPPREEAAAPEEATTPAVEEESAAEEVAAPVAEEAPVPATPDEPSAVEAPVEMAPEAQPETLSQPQEAAFAPPVQEVAPFPAPATPVETEKPDEKHHWYDRIFNLFGGHDNKPAPPAPAEPPSQSVAPASFEQVEAPAPSLAPENAVETVPVETGPVPAFEAPQVYVTEPEAYQPDYTAEQALFGSDESPAPGTIEAATEPARFEAVTIAQPEVLPVDFMPTPAEIGPEPSEPFSQPESQVAAPVESSQEIGAPALQPETETPESQPSPVYPPSEPAQEAESFYPFELETPKSTNYDAYYGSDSPDEQPGQSGSFNYDLTGFEKSSPASTYSQDFSYGGPSAYPFELPAEEPSNTYFQSFAPSASPVEEAQPEAVIPPFSLEPEKAADQPSSLFENAPSVGGHPQFTADDLELPSWLDEPATLQPEPEPAQAAPSVTPPVEVAEPAQEPEPEVAEEAATPAGNDFNWAGNTTEEDELPGWLKAAKDDSGLPDWLKVSTEPTTAAPQAPIAAAPENAPVSSVPQPPNLRDAPAVEIPNKDWLENENLFEDDDFFSLLNQSGLDLSLERGGTGTLNTPPASSPATSEAAPPATAGGNTPVQSVQAAPVQPAPSTPAPSGPEPEFDNLFDEVEPNPAPAKVTVRQLIDRNDGYTAPLSYEDLDMSVPLGLDDDVTRPGTFQPVPLAPVAPPPPPVPTRAEPPGFHRVDLGRGRTSVELANVRTIPSYDKNTVVRVSEEGERFEFDGWIDGPELRGSTRWYRILTPSGDEWIHSTLVQLDRPFRG